MHSKVFNKGVCILMGGDSWLDGEGMMTNFSDDDSKKGGLLSSGTSDDLLGALQVFRRIPKHCQAVFLMRLYELDWGMIAEAEKISIREAEKRFNKAEEIVHRRIESQVESLLFRRETLGSADSTGPEMKMVEGILSLVSSEDLEIYRFHKEGRGNRDTIQTLKFTKSEMESRFRAVRKFFHDRQKFLIFRLLEIPPDSPSLLDEVVPLVNRLRILFTNYFEKERQRKILENIKITPYLTRTEMHEAGVAFFGLNRSLRETFLLHEVANLDTLDVAVTLGISMNEVGDRLFNVRKILSRRMERLVLQMLHDKSALSDSECKIARILLDQLTENDRKTLRTAAKKGDRLIKKWDQKTDNSSPLFRIITELGMQMEMRIIAWTRWFVGGTLTKKTARSLARNQRLAQKPATAKMNPLEFAISLLNLEQRRILLLAEGQDLSISKIAALQGISEEEVNFQILEAWHGVFLRVEQMISSQFLQSGNGWKRSRIKPKEQAIVRSLLEKIPHDDLRVYAAYMLTTDLIPKIAGDFGIPEKEAERRIIDTKQKVIDQTKILVRNALRQLKKSQTVAERLLERSHKQSKIFYRRPSSKEQKDVETQKLNAIKNLLAAAPSLGRVAFLLHHSGTLAYEDMIYFSGLGAEKMEQFCAETEDILYQGVEEYVDAVLQKKQLSDGARLIGEDALAQVSENLLEPYRLYYLDNVPLEKIAEMLGTRSQEIQKQIESVRRTLHQRIERITLKLLDSSTFAPTYQAVSDDVFQVLAIRKMKKEMSPEEWGLVRSEARRAAQQVAPVSVKRKRSREVDRKKSVQTAAAVVPMFSFIPEGVSFSTLVLFPTVLFLAVIAFLIGGQLCGTTFVRTAPTLEARRWLIAQVFRIFVFVCAVPIILIVGAGATAIYYPADRNQLLWLNACVATLFGIFLIASFYNTVKCGSKWQLITENNFDHSCPSPPFQGISIPSFENLTKNIHNGLVFIGILFLILILFIFFCIVLPSYRENCNVYYGHIVLMGILAIAYTGAFLMFRDFLKISKDDMAFENYPRIDIKKVNRNLYEFLCIAPLAAFYPVGVNLYQFCCNNTQPIITSTTLSVCTAWWAAIWYWNTQSAQGRWTKIFITFGFQIFVTRVLRHFIYPMFF